MEGDGWAGRAAFRRDEAMRQSERAVELDPVEPIITAFYAFVLLCARRYDDSIVQARRALRLEPNHSAALGYLFWALHESGQRDEAIKAATRFYADWANSPDVGEALERGYAEEGYASAWRRAADVEASRHAEEPGIGWYAASNYMLAGDTARALDWLEKAVAQRDPNAPVVKCVPIWDPVRGSPRFHALLRKMNLPVDEKE